MSLRSAEYTGLDTNVMLRYLLRDDEAQYLVAEREFAGFDPQHIGFITQVTLAEVYWVLSQRRKLGRAGALAVIRRIIETESFEFDDGEGVVRALTLAEEGADFGDALIQGAMELFGVERTLTFDRRAADRLGWELLA